MASGSIVGDSWLAETADAVGGTVAHDVTEGGLLEDMAHLDGPGFCAGDLHPERQDHVTARRVLVHVRRRRHPPTGPFPRQRHHSLDGRHFTLTQPSNRDTAPIGSLAHGESLRALVLVALHQ